MTSNIRQFLKRVTAIFLVVTICFLTCPILELYGATSKIVANWFGCLEYGEEKSFSFSAIDDGVLKIDFDWEDEPRENITIDIIDTFEDEFVFKSKYFTPKDSTKWEISLPASNYRLSITADDGTAINIDAIFTVGKRVTYSKLVSEAKKLKTKNIIFKNVDIGYHSRLYGKGVAASLLNKDEIYAMGSSFEPFIDMKKTDYGSQLKMMLRGTTKLVSYESNPMYMEKLTIYTNDRTVTFPLSYSNDKEKYSYRNGIYTNTCYWSATMSSNEKVRTEQMNKLMKILKSSKTVKVKVKGEDGAFYWIKLSKQSKQNWYYTCQKYQKLLKLYS